MSSKKIKALSNHEIVTLAVYLLGGASKRIDSEDVAVKANELAPGRFTWRKYPEQINLKNISAFLWDAGKPKNGSQLIGTDVDGWMLTESGLKFAQVRVKKLENVNLARNSISPKERNLLRRETDS
jgi:phospholipase C